MDGQGLVFLVVLRLCFQAEVADKRRVLSVLDESDVVGVLAEATTADVHVVLADEALVGTADAAAKVSDSQ